MNIEPTSPGVGEPEALLPLDLAKPLNGFKAEPTIKEDQNSPYTHSNTQDRTWMAASRSFTFQQTNSNLLTYQFNDWTDVISSGDLELYSKTVKACYRACLVYLEVERQQKFIKEYRQWVKECQNHIKERFLHFLAEIKASQ